jgi:4'-phosphopantetheinyl transferase
MLSRSPFLDQFVRTVAHPPYETGHFAAWGLDCGRLGEPQVTVLTSRADTPARAPSPDEMFVWFGAPTPGAEYALCDDAFPLLVNSNVLDEEEIDKASAFIQRADRWSYVVAHAMLRTVLAGALGCAPDRVRIVRDARGKPSLSAAYYGRKTADSLHFNISHTRGLSAVALAGRPVGIDVETPVSMPEIDEFARNFLATEALAALRNVSDDRDKVALFFRFWTLSEAFIKATGLGIEQGLKSFAFSPTGRPRLLRVTPGWGPAERWRFGLAMNERPALGASSE